MTLMVQNSSYDAPSVSDLNAWASDYGLSFPVLADEDMGVTSGFIWADGVTSIRPPSKHLIGPGMEVLAINEWSITNSLIEAHLPY